MSFYYIIDINPSRTRRVVLSIFSRASDPGQRGNLRATENHGKYENHYRNHGKMRLNPKFIM